MPNFSKEPYAITGGGGGGMRFLSGEGEPTADTGQPGDVYLDTTNGDLYENVNGTWTKDMNLRGPQGDQGPQGDTGEQGEQGPAGADGVSVTGATSDGTNITFTLSDGSTIDVPWPTQ